MADRIASILAELQDSDDWKLRAPLLRQLVGKTDPRIVGIIPGLLDEFGAQIDTLAEQKVVDVSQVQTDIEEIVLGFGEDAFPVIQNIGQSDFRGVAVWMLWNLVTRRGSERATREMIAMLDRERDFVVAQELIMA